MADDLCPECTRALVTGVDEAPQEAFSPVDEEHADHLRAPSSPEEEAAHPDPSRNLQRPPGVTILAVQFVVSSLPSLLFAILLPVAPNAAAALDKALSHSSQPWPVSYVTLESRLSSALVCLLSVFLGCLVARGLWRLKNWARRFAIVFCILDVVIGGPYLFFWPLFEILPNSPIFDLTARLLSILLICYWFSSSVKTAFRVPDPRRGWFYATVGVVVASLVFTVSKSSAEIKAIQWHLHHGNQITVNGVTFPVYTWYSPVQSCSGAGFHVDDIPGPLRPKDRTTFLIVGSCKEEEEDRTLTIEQLADKELHDYEKAGYTGLRRFRMQVRDESLECMESALYGHAIYCYGNGPIGRIFFTGGNESLGRFQRMIAEAR